MSFRARFTRCLPDPPHPRLLLMLQPACYRASRLRSPGRAGGDGINPAGAAPPAAARRAARMQQLVPDCVPLPPPARTTHALPGNASRLHIQPGRGATLHIFIDMGAQAGGWVLPVPGSHRCLFCPSRCMVPQMLPAPSFPLPVACLCAYSRLHMGSAGDWHEAGDSCHRLWRLCLPQRGLQLLGRRGSREEAGGAAAGGAPGGAQES